MKRVYLAGPINGKTDEECNGWRDKATHLLAGSMVVVSPMARDYRGKEDENVAEIVAGDIRDIESCDFVLANVESPSWGTAMELWHASKAEKKIVAFIRGDRVSPWLRYVCAAIYDSPERACMAILNFDVLCGESDRLPRIAQHATAGGCEEVPDAAAAGSNKEDSQ